MPGKFAFSLGHELLLRHCDVCAALFTAIADDTLALEFAFRRNRNLLRDYRVGFASLAEPFLLLLVSIIVPRMPAILHPEASLISDVFALLAEAFVMNL